MCKETIKKFIEGWSNKDYDLLYDISVMHMKTNTDKITLTEIMKQTLLVQTVSKIEMVAIKETNKLVKTILFKVQFLDGDMEDGLYAVNFLKELRAYQLSEDGKWGFNPISVRKYSKDNF